LAHAEAFRLPAMRCSPLRARRALLPPKAQRHELKVADARPACSRIWGWLRVVVPTDQDIYRSKSWDEDALVQPASRAALAEFTRMGGRRPGNSPKRADVHLLALPAERWEVRAGRNHGPPGSGSGRLGRITFPRKSIGGLHFVCPRLGTSPAGLRYVAAPQKTGFVGGLRGSCASMLTS
jgi:hypothetical protein